MVINVFVALVWILAYHSPVYQTDDVILTLKLSGTAIDEGHNKPVAYFTFYEFDKKCRLRGVGKVKLNKRTRSATRSCPAGKPVYMSFYYADLRTRYGRSSHEYLVFHPQRGKNYDLEMKVEGSSLTVRIFEKSEIPGEKKEVGVLKGYKHVKCMEEHEDTRKH